MQIHIIKTRSFKFSPIIGIGYWKDIYIEEEIGMGGVSHNFIIPFFRIQWGHLIIKKRSPEYIGGSRIEIPLKGESMGMSTPPNIIGTLDRSKL